MKKVEVIVRGQFLKDVEALLDRVKVSGYTIIPDISGKGHHGMHEGHLIFNEMHSMVMVITVLPKEKVETVLAGVKPMLEHHSGVVFVSDVEVVRRDYFNIP
jgi:nitrogen regulatory protein PII